METDCTNPLTNDTRTDRLDRIIECMMAALLAFMPFAFGAVEPWAEEVVVVLAGMMALCLLLKFLLQPGTRGVWTWAYVPLGLFLFLVVLQQIPLPSGVVSLVAPNIVKFKTSLLSGLSVPDGGTTISLYPLATQRALRLALAVAAIFVVTVNVYRSAKQIERLLTIVVIVGAAVALLALAQIVTRTQKIYWLVDVPAMAGTFVNRNHYCQFMNLSLGAALGLLLVRFRRHLHGTPATLSSVVERISSQSFRPTWYLGGMIVLAAASVFLSLSRGGMVSLLVAWGMTVAVLGLRGRLRAYGWVMSALAVGAFACVLYVSFNSVYDRFSSLTQVGGHQGRWQLIVDSGRAWSKFPAIGAGLGTHEYVFPMFDRSPILARATHAENEYVQMSEETGLIGLMLIGLFGAILLRSFLRCLRKQHSSVAVAAIGLGSGILAVLVHSLCDFGLHLPANAILAAVFCGLLVAMARIDRSPQDSAQGRKNTVRRWAVVLGLVSVMLGWGWVVITADRARRGEGYWRKAQQLEARMRENNWAVANADYARLIDLTQNAADKQPKNVLYRHWLNAHRWRAISRIIEPKTGHVILNSVAKQTVGQIVLDLEQTSALCPTFGPSYSLAGQLRRFVLDDPRGEELIRQGRALAPCDPIACFADGMLDAHKGNFPESLATFRRVLTLDGSWFELAVKVYIYQVARPDLAIEIAKDDVSHLFAVAELLEAEGYQPLADEARQQAQCLLRIQCESPDAPAHMLVRAAEHCLQNNEYDQATAYYRRAISRQSANISWRLRFAEALAAAGQISQARQQAGICLKLRPGMPEAQHLIADLRSRSSGRYKQN